MSGFIELIAQVTPALLLHRRGRKLDLQALTPAAMADARLTTASA